MRLILILALTSIFAAPTEPQQGVPAPNKDACKDICLEKEVSDFTRVVEADGQKPKIRFLAEDFTWSDEYRRAAIDVVKSQFSNNLLAGEDQPFGIVLILYIQGTPAVSNGAQFVNVRIQIQSDELFLPEAMKNLFDIRPAKIGDPTRLVEGYLVFAENGILLAPMQQGMPFELWHQLNVQKVRETIKKTLSEFDTKWEKAGRK